MAGTRTGRCSWRSTARARAPWSSTYLLNEARALTQLAAAQNDPAVRDRASAVASRAVQADPNNPITYAGAAEIYLANGRPSAALEAALGAIRIVNTDPTYDQLARRAAEQSADPAEAMSMLQEILRTKDTAQLRIALAEVALKAGDRGLARESAARARVFFSIQPQQKINLNLFLTAHHIGHLVHRHRLHIHVTHT